MANLRNIIQQLAAPDRETVALVAVVDSVDTTARTVDCTPLNEGAPLLGVNLQANQQGAAGVALWPKVGSFVVVGFIAEGAAGVVLLTDEIEKAEITIGDTTASITADTIDVKVGQTTAQLTPEGVELNGGTLGGLVIAGDLTNRLNIIERDINSLKAVLTGWVPVAQDGGAALKAAAADWAAAQLTPTQTTDYENKKVTH